MQATDYELKSEVTLTFSDGDFEKIGLQFLSIYGQAAHVDHKALVNYVLSDPAQMGQSAQLCQLLGVALSSSADHKVLVNYVLSNPAKIAQYPQLCHLLGLALSSTNSHTNLDTKGRFQISMLLFLLAGDLAIENRAQLVKRFESKGSHAELMTPVYTALSQLAGNTQSPYHQIILAHMAFTWHGQIPGCTMESAKSLLRQKTLREKIAEIKDEALSTFYLTMRFHLCREIAKSVEMKGNGAEFKETAKFLSELLSIKDFKKYDLSFLNEIPLTPEKVKVLLHNFRKSGFEPAIAFFEEKLKLTQAPQLPATDARQAQYHAGANGYHNGYQGGAAAQKTPHDPNNKDDGRLSHGRSLLGAVTGLFK